MGERDDRALSEVFISYSRHDVQFVGPIVGLLRLIDPAVFLDQDCIRPGKPWRVEITQAIDRCRLLIVFWCEHAAASQEVKKEYRRGIRLKKDVVPVLLDETPLPRALGKYQAISMGEALIRLHYDTARELVNNYVGGPPTSLDPWLKDPAGRGHYQPPAQFYLFFRTLLPRLAPTEPDAPPKRRPSRKRIKD